MTRIARGVEQRGAFVAAVVAGLAALPGLSFPFLSDDWHLVQSVSTGSVPIAPYGYFRPIYGASYWLDYRLWGAAPALFHLTNLLLIVAAAALVVAAVRCYTADPAIAGWTGLLFALHPSHVENAAWIAVRGDPLYSIPVLASLLTYDRWRARMRAVPILAMVLFEVGLLAKESAVVLPLLLLTIGLVERSRRPSAAEAARGYLPLILVAAGHFFLLRPAILAAAPRTLAPGFGIGWVKQALGYVVAVVLPADVDLLVHRPTLWGAAGGVALGGLLLVARARSGRVPGMAVAAAIVFAVALGPSVVGFEDRYLFLPAAGACLALASLVRAAKGRIALALAVALGAGWSVGLAVQWASWNEAAIASRSLVSGLVAASREPGAGELVVANMPFRVRHGSVAGDFRAALSVAGGRPMPVLFGCELALPGASADALDGPMASAVTPPPPEAVVRLSVPEGAFSRLVWPRPAAAGTVVEAAAGSVVFRDARRLDVHVRPAPERGRRIYVWSRGVLVPLRP